MVPNRNSCGTGPKSFGTGGSEVTFLQHGPQVLRNGWFRGQSVFGTDGSESELPSERKVPKKRGRCERVFLQSVEPKCFRTRISEPRCRQNGWLRTEIPAERTPSPSERMATKPSFHRSGWFRKSGVLPNGHLAVCRAHVFYHLEKRASCGPWMEQCFHSIPCQEQAFQRGGPRQEKLAHSGLGKVAWEALEFSRGAKGKVGIRPRGIASSVGWETNLAQAICPLGAGDTIFRRTQFGVKLR